jgi:hypothetical protein
MTPKEEHGSGTFLEIFSEDVWVYLRLLTDWQSLYLSEPWF